MAACVGQCCCRAAAFVRQLLENPVEQGAVGRVCLCVILQSTCHGALCVHTWCRVWLGGVVLQCLCAVCVCSCGANEQLSPRVLISCGLGRS